MKQVRSIVTKFITTIPRLLFCGVCSLFGIMMVYIAHNDNQPYYYLFSMLCFVVTFAFVLTGRIKQFCLCILSTMLIILSAGYVFSELLTGTKILSSRNEPSLLNSILFTIFYGVPAFSYVKNTKFGFYRKLD